ncbi:izumo sperm-egg fusion protein 2 isoform X3 [Podarcis raffonei]|uniref:izumo sperm-egg fusion protein 2 isoform X3 n=1 Tax=Podarcis raffonei TaxID=65483 RepID=UPI0023291C9B|nr:izumo sperm-egg fusion protein 2 isoform X3 [Podarcis raffonei]
MPPLGPLLWLLLLAWFPISLRGCLQCDQKFKENVAKLRTEIVPSKIQDSRLKERAEVLLSGLEGNFFLHYATSQFSGLAVKSKVDALIHEARFSTESLLQTHLTDQALLDELVEFRRKMTMKLKEALKEHQMKGIFLPCGNALDVERNKSGDNRIFGACTLILGLCFSSPHSLRQICLRLAEL